MHDADETALRLGCDAETVTVIILVVGAWWMLFQRRAYPHVVRRVLFFGAAWYAITIAPMIVTYLSARHLYITTAGLSLAVASLVFTASPAEQQRRVKARAVMASMLFVLCSIAAIWNASVWVTSGRESQRFASAVSRLAPAIPRGSIVFVSAPEWNRDGWFWSWAMPFALQPPFTSEDLYQRFRIVERPLIVGSEAQRPTVVVARLVRDVADQVVTARRGERELRAGDRALS